MSRLVYAVGASLLVFGPTFVLLAVLWLGESIYERRDRRRWPR